MKQTWKASGWGTTFTKTESWQLTLEEQTITIEVSGKKYSAHISGAKAISVTPGIFWSEVSFIPKGANPVKLDGLPNSDARKLLVTLQSSLAIYEKTIARKQRLQKFEEFLAPIVEWGNSVVQSAISHKNKHHWIAEETLQEWLRTKPTGEAEGTSFIQLLKDPDVSSYLAKKTDESKNRIEIWKYDLRSEVNSLNQKHLQAELVDCKDFFDKVEKSPLTEEQAKAVVCFDNRVLTIASAGSGKTSTMVAKAGYALHRGLIDPDQILLLAFNADAAKELQKRILDRLNPLHFPADKIVARTFHAFGLDVIGKATGKKPTLAPWLEHGGDIEKLSELIDSVKDRDIAFRTKWDLFRVVFSRDLPKFGKEEENHEDWDRDTQKTGFRTLNGGVVKSHNERLIADWLFYNGVQYRYESPYEIDTADPTHRQYHPDFYYPDVNVYHEHFALDEKGCPPPEFEGYLEGVQWKRALHKQHGTKFFETTSADLRSGKAFKILKKELTKYGITLDPNPDRPVQGRKIIEHKELVKVFRTFLTHAKSNQLNTAALRNRLQEELPGTFVYRHEMFLDLFETIRSEWENHLREKSFIDFEDMLNLAADHLEASHWQSPYELVMVDEFQDVSRARARLTRALVNKPNRFLFAVGDDWQSINRYAGSDISVMTGFESWFGKGHTLRLERTFRCPQSLCDISSQFVLKNPIQIQKKVASTETEHPPTIQAFQVSDDTKILGAIDKYLEKLCQALISGKISKARKGKLSVFILGRYRKDRQYLPSDWEHKYGEYLTVSFSTVHSSKGLEADYVILPRVVRGAYSFPSTIEDDPVLQLAMPSNDTHPFSEERRLFYVALTRARRSVVLITVENSLSEFINELVKNGKVEVLGIDGKPSNLQLCPKCKTGSIVEKTGKHGAFKGCNNFPKCRHIIKTPRKTLKQQSTFKA